MTDPVDKRFLTFDPDESLAEVLASMRRLADRDGDLRYDEYADRIEAALARGSKPDQSPRELWRSAGSDRVRMVGDDRSSLYFVYPTYDRGELVGYGVTIDNLSAHPTINAAMRSAERHLAKVRAGAPSAEGPHDGTAPMRASEQHLREALGVARVFVESEARRRVDEGQNNHAMKVLQYIDECPALADATRPPDGTAPERTLREALLGTDVKIVAMIDTVAEIVLDIREGRIDDVDYMPRRLDALRHRMMQTRAGIAAVGCGSDDVRAEQPAARPPDGIPGEPARARKLLTEREYAEDEEEANAFSRESARLREEQRDRAALVELAKHEIRNLACADEDADAAIARIEHAAAPPTVPGEPPAGLLDALVTAAIGECERAVRQARTSETWETCFRAAFARILSAAPPTVPGEPDAAPMGGVFYTARPGSMTDPAPADWVRGAGDSLTDGQVTLSLHEGVLGIDGYVTDETGNVSIPLFAIDALREIANGEEGGPRECLVCDAPAPADALILKGHHWLCPDHRPIGGTRVER